MFTFIFASEQMLLSSGFSTDLYIESESKRVTDINRLQNVERKRGGMAKSRNLLGIYCDVTGKQGALTRK
jgi:hypothetical protein